MLPAKETRGQRRTRGEVVGEARCQLQRAARQDDRAAGGAADVVQAGDVQRALVDRDRARRGRIAAGQEQRARAGLGDPRAHSRQVRADGHARRRRVQLVEDVFRGVGGDAVGEAVQGHALRRGRAEEEERAAIHRQAGARQAVAGLSSPVGPTKTYFFVRPSR